MCSYNLIKLYLPFPELSAVISLHADHEYYISRHLAGFLFVNFLINVLNAAFVCLCQGNAKTSCSVYLP